MALLLQIFLFYWCILDDNVPRGTITKMEELNHCEVCHKPLKDSVKGKLSELFLEAEDTLGSKKTFKIEKCRVCDFVFTNPRPSTKEIAQYYHSEAYISHTEQKQSIKDKIYFIIQKIMLRRKVALLKKHTTSQHRMLLDYGCGTGNFIDHSMQNGFQTAGYEPEPNARSKAKAKGLKIIKDKDLLFGNKTPVFDVITLWHVLEHLHDFRTYLDKFHTKLNTGGLLVVAVPMANCSDAGYYGQHWAGWDLPRHLYHFTPDSLLRCCEDAGYELIERKGMPFDSYYVAWLSEQNKGSRMAPLRAFLIGSWSNIRALFRKTPWSSEIFVLRKK